MAGDEQAVICVLMLRGPQTPGELKQRAERMHSFPELAAVHETLARLIERGLAACLQRRPGQKEDRYVQLLEDRDAQVGASQRGGHRGSVARGHAVFLLESSAAFMPRHPVDGLEERVARLEGEVADAARALGSDARRAAEPERRRRSRQATARTSGPIERGMSHAQLIIAIPRLTPPRVWASRLRSPRGSCRSSRPACCRSFPAISRR